MATPLDTGDAGGRHAKVKWDLTFNVPTMLALLTLAASGLSFTFSAYREFDQRVTRNTYESQILREKVTALEAQITSVRSESNASMQTLRAEIRSDLNDIKSKLDNFIIGRRSNRNWEQ